MGYRNLRASSVHHIVGCFWRILDVEIGLFFREVEFGGMVWAQALGFAPKSKVQRPRSKVKITEYL